MRMRSLQPALIVATLLFSLPFTLHSQTRIQLQTLRASEAEDSLYSIQFSNYTLATLDMASVAEMLRSQDAFEEIQLTVDGKSYRFSLEARDLRAPHYKLRVGTENGIVEWPRTPNMTYAGQTLKEKLPVRITSETGYFVALIMENEDELYIEPAHHFNPEADRNEVVVYKASHNLNKFSPGMCGVPNVANIETEEDDHTHAHHEHGDGRAACKKVQVALADDLLMFQAYGSVADVQAHNMAVINNVETNYDTEFNDDLQFEVVEIYVATTAGTDPWTNSTDPGDLLDDFTDWGPSGFSNTHDVASLWSDRNFNGPTIGLAWVGTVCTFFKYNVLQDFSGNANLLRVLQAHELGHNFDANHDPENSGTIMAPSVNNTNSWSNQSINQINAYINSVNCLGPCSSPQPPVSNFAANPTAGCVPLQVQFFDQSLNNPTSWNWSFPGGTPATSSLQNPIVTYNNPGSYNVTLTVMNAQGSNSHTKTNFISTGENPIADFDYTINGLEVEFENFSINADSYLWEFGDGFTSSQFNPIHEYPGDGTYVVTLTAFNDCGSDQHTIIIEIITLPEAVFSSNTTSGCSPFEVEFFNFSSANAESFFWSFPGGIPATSTAFEPLVLYETPGTYNVTLTAINQAGEDVFTAVNYITVLPQPVAEFDFTTNGLTVNFNSTGSVGNSYLWNFGDGDVSTQANPSHTYSGTGTYVVTLTVSNQCGSQMLQLSVSVTGAPQAGIVSSIQNGCPALTVQFNSVSGGNPTSYNWIFEGGVPATSTLPNPLVTYFNPGSFNVQLTVTNATGSDVLLLNDYIVVQNPTVSDFTFVTDGLQAFFTDQSDFATSWMWTFGDGQSSTDPSPTHVYNQDGVYTVTLISTGICGSDTSTATITIETPAQASFTFNASSSCSPTTVNFFNQSSPNTTAVQWSFPGGSPSSSTQFNPVITYNNPGVYNVTLIAIAPGGSDTMTWPQLIELGAKPDAAFLINSTNLEVMMDNQTSGASSYLWLFGDGESSNEQNPVHIYPGYGTYSLTLIAYNDCGSDTMTVVLELSTIPNAFFSYNGHTGCAPFQVQFTDQSQNNPTSWAWEFPGGNPATSNVKNPLVTYAIPGNYFVSLTVSNSEGSDAILLDNLIRVAGDPDATFEHEQVENVVFLEYTGTDYDSLRWYFGDGRTNTSLNPTIEYNETGQYLVELIVYNACGSDTSSLWVTITITSTFDAHANKDGWRLQPNPFSDLLTLYGEPASNGTMAVRVFDAHGKLLDQQRLDFAAGPVTHEMVSTDFPQGVILIQLIREDQTVVLKGVHQE